MLPPAARDLYREGGGASGRERAKTSDAAVTTRAKREWGQGGWRPGRPAERRMQGVSVGAGKVRISDSARHFIAGLKPRPGSRTIEGGRPV